jgi:hypothetical protein
MIREQDIVACDSTRVTPRYRLLLLEAGSAASLQLPISSE